jgi:O-methyltransferase
MKRIVRKIFENRGIAIKRFQPLSPTIKAKLADVAEYTVYQHGMVFAPWLKDTKFLSFYESVEQHTVSAPERCWVLFSLAHQCSSLSGEWWECGVYRGGTALLLRGLRDQLCPQTHLRLFDTFGGMPKTRADKDVHVEGDFMDTSLQAVQTVVGNENVSFHKGTIPGSFTDVPSNALSLVHIDLDIYDGILSSCERVYDRMTRGGMIVFDDYGFPSCPGARAAVDEFFSGKPEFPLVLPTGQALVTKL